VDNPRTIGPVDTRGKIVIGMFHGIQLRTAGFNSIDMGQAEP
jgi:trk system potassium uptake protein